MHHTHSAVCIQLYYCEPVGYNITTVCIALLCIALLCVYTLLNVCNVSFPLLFIHRFIANSQHLVMFRCSVIFKTRVSHCCKNSNIISKYALRKVDLELLIIFCNKMFFSKETCSISIQFSKCMLYLFNSVQWRKRVPVKSVVARFSFSLWTYTSTLNAFTMLPYFTNEAHVR